MSEKLELKEKLAAIDVGARDLWDEVSDEERKRIKGEFFIINRYISNVKTGNRDIQEHFVLAVNEYFNKHWYVLQSHPKLLWQLICMCSHESKNIFFHEWIGFKKKEKGTNKKTKFLLEAFPNAKLDEIELMSKITPVNELKKHAVRLGYDDSQIKKLFD
jgi:hypothetical protein